MKQRTRNSLLAGTATAVLALLFVTVASASSPAAAAERFDQIKALVGVWHGEMHDGSKVELVYALTGQGTSVVETFRKLDSGDHDMLTVYHVAGDRLMLTHYCIAGNQPRMVAAAGGDPKTLRFDFLDVTGNTEGGHMHHAVVELEGADHMRQAWTYRREGKDAFTEAIEYHRVR